MPYGMYISAEGANAQSQRLEVIANNLANINTNGYKRAQINFQDLLYLKLREAGREIASGIISPSGLEIGSGVVVTGEHCDQVALANFGEQGRQRYFLPFSHFSSSMFQDMKFGCKDFI